MNHDTKNRFYLMLGVVLAAALMRVLPHPWNFTPVAAMALFGGAHFSSRWWAFLAPLGALFLSDAAIEMLYRMGAYPHAGFESLLGRAVIYAAFALIVGVGFVLRERRTSPLPVAGASLAASTLFFLVTNFAVWAGSGMYPATPAGLAACYVAAIPFFGGTLMGDLFYTAVFFGAFAFMERKVPAFAAVRAG